MVEITFRTTGVWGAGKGANLKPTEVDTNFYNLKAAIEALEANPPQPNNISNITVTGTQMTIVLEDATEFGPFTLPRAPFQPAVPGTVTASTDGTYDPVLADANTYKRYSGSSPLTVIVPDNASVAFLIGTEIVFYQAGSGAIAFEAPTDVTINPAPGCLDETAQRGASLTLKKVGTDEWDLIGWRAEDTTA